MSYDLSSKPLSLWTPDDVCAWVDGMGLGQLAPAFKSNGGTWRVAGQGGAGPSHRRHANSTPWRGPT